MSDEPDKQSLLAAFELGPSWARKDAPAKKYEDHRGEDKDARRGRGRRDGGRREGGGDRGRREWKGKGRPPGGGGRGDRGGRPPRDLPDPAQGVRVTLAPSKEAVHLIVREIHHVARVYSLFDIAQILLGSRERYRLQVTVDPKRDPLFRGRKDASLFESKEEAVAHFWSSGFVGDHYETDEVETEAPSGNFQVVARCGISGEWLGPPNFHSYQANLRRLHRERFAHMDFDRYAAKVRTERGEEAVNAWLESMRKRVRWRPKGGGDEDWTFDRAVVERDFATRCFGEVFEETRECELPGDVPGHHLSPGLLAVIRIAGNHARRHPAMLIPTICRMLESEHLAIFKRKGKLFSGPARPHPLPADAVLSERPRQVVEWLDVHPDSKLGEMWEALLPEDAKEPPKEWLVDLFWLLTQGHVLLFSDDTLVLPKRRKPQGDAPAADSPAPSKRKRKKKQKRKTWKARHPSRAKTIRLISRMNAGAVKALRGHSRVLGRRLARRGQIDSLRGENESRRPLRR